MCYSGVSQGFKRMIQAHLEPTSSVIPFSGIFTTQFPVTVIAPKLHSPNPQANKTVAFYLNYSCPEPDRLQSTPGKIHKCIDLIQCGSSY